MNISVNKLYNYLNKSIEKTNSAIKGLEAVEMGQIEKQTLKNKWLGQIEAYHDLLYKLDIIKEILEDENRN